jgi:hypothetical protein
VISDTYEKREGKKKNRENHQNGGKKKLNEVTEPLIRFAGCSLSIRIPLISWFKRFFYLMQVGRKKKNCEEIGKQDFSHTAGSFGNIY